MSTITRTGGFAVGFRQGWTDWQKDYASLGAWAKTEGFAHVDPGKDGPDAIAALAAAGVGVGSVDLLDWQGMSAADKGERADSIAANAEYVKACGATNYFVVLLPKDPSLPRTENFGHAVESYSELAGALEQSGGKLVIEGWPGPGALATTPESFRAFFREVPSEAMGINYDPSHLIRMGIDPIRFLAEFVGRVYHVHAKDTELLDERLYELGREVPALEAPGIFCGGSHWRYCIPGHGIMRWSHAFEILAAAGYRGVVSIELEDVNFNPGGEAGEKLGLTLGRDYLRGA